MRSRPAEMQQVVSKLGKLGLSLSWLAEELGLRRATVCAWNVVPVEYLEFVAKTTGIPPNKLRPDLAPILRGREFLE